MTAILLTVGFIIGANAGFCVGAWWGGRNLERLAAAIAEMISANKDTTK